MEPNGSYTSEDYISYVSPLHEVLRGTTVMPTLEQFQKLHNFVSILTPFMNSMSMIIEPEEAMFPSTEHSTFSYNMDSTNPFLANFTAPSLAKSEDYISYVSPLHEALRGTTAMPTLEQFQKLNNSMLISTQFMADFTATSRIQGNPLAIMDSSLNSSGGSRPSPVFEYPEWLLYGEQKQNAILRTSPDEELYGTVPHVNAAHISPFPESTQAQLEIQQIMGVSDATFQQNIALSTSSIVPGPSGPREYTCKPCKMTFYTPQAYGGHMSSHAKAKNKMLLG